MGILLEMQAPSSLKPEACNTRSLLVALAEVDSSVREVLADGLNQDHHVTCYTSYKDVKQAIDHNKLDLLIIGNLEDMSCLEAFREFSKQSHHNLPIFLLSHTSDVNQFFRDWVIAKGGYDVLSSFPEKLHILRQELQKLAQLYQESEGSLAVSLPVNPQKIPPIPADNLLIAQSQVSQQTHHNFEPLAKNLSPSDEISDLNPSPKLDANARSPQTLTYRQTLDALNQISETSLRYFGGLVMGNYWKKVQKSLVADHLWLECWTVNHNGAISFVSETIPPEAITDRQFTSLLLWVKGFLKECDRIVVDYIELLQQSNPSEEVRSILASI